MNNCNISNTSLFLPRNGTVWLLIATNDDLDIITLATRYDSHLQFSGFKHEFDKYKIKITLTIITISNISGLKASSQPTEFSSLMWMSFNFKLSTQCNNCH